MFKFEAINTNSPLTGNGIALQLKDGKIYLHGGFKKHGITKPEGHLWSFDLHKNLWTNISGPDCPRLANHAAFVSNRCLITVGGWDGKERTSDLHRFDPRTGKWQLLQSEGGFPRGAGLSCHTVTPIGESEDAALVIGRYGGIRTQRKSSESLILRLLPGGKYSYGEEENVPKNTIASRSGHTATPLDTNSLLIVGGRHESNGLDWDQISIDDADQPETASYFKFDNSKILLSGIPVARKFHTATKLSGNRVLMIGGETFSALSPSPLSSISVYDNDINKYHGSPWLQVSNQSAMPISGHNAIVHDGQILLCGGFCERFSPNRVLYKIVEVSE